MVKKLGIYGLSVLFLFLFCFFLAGRASSKTAEDLLNEAKAVVHSDSIGEVKKSVESKEKLVIMDVRDLKDYVMGHIANAISMPRAVNLSDRLLEYHLNKLVPDKNAKIIVYCEFDTRSPLAVKAMNELGYKNAVHMKGGFKAWREAGYPTEK